MALDHTLFLRAAEMNRQRDNDMWSGLENTLGSIKEQKRYDTELEMRRKELENKGFDIEALAKSAAMKSEMGIEPTPEEIAGFGAYQKFEGAKLGQNPVTGDLYPKYRAFELGGKKGGFDLGGPVKPTGFAGGTTYPEIGNMGAPSYAPAANDKPLSLADLQGMIPAMDVSQLEGDALPKVEYLPPLPADAQGFNVNQFRPMTGEDNLRLPTPANPVQEKMNYEARIDAAKSAANEQAKANIDLQKEQQKNVQSKAAKVSSLSTAIDSINAIDTLLSDPNSPSGALEGIAATVANKAGYPTQASLVQAELEPKIELLTTQLKDYIRSPGEGTWTDADQKKLDRLAPKEDDSLPVKIRKLKSLRDEFIRLQGGRYNPVGTAPTGAVSYEEYFR